MAETLTFETQQPDFGVKEAGAVDPEEAARLVREHNWAHQFARFKDLAAAGKHCCPAGAYLRKPDQSLLNVCQLDTDRFRLELSIPVPKKFLGLIPMEGRWEQDREAVDVEGLMDWVELFATQPNEEVMRQLA